MRITRPAGLLPPEDLSQVDAGNGNGHWRGRRRPDFSEEPIAELGRLSEFWESMMEGYIKRCLDPENSPAAASIEGHITRMSAGR